MTAVVRNNGDTGLSRMAISAVDSALWDLRAERLDVPLVRLLAAAREAIGGVVSLFADVNGGVQPPGQASVTEGVSHFAGMCVVCHGGPGVEPPEKIPHGTTYASLMESDVPVVMQHTRLDSRHAENTLLSTMAFRAD